jgi:preprotein translocase subunit SecE
VTSQTTTPTTRPSTAAGGKGGRGKRPGRVAGINLFVRETVAEMRKVIYPTRTELVSYTLVVLVFVTAVVLIVSGLDFVFSELVVRIFG